MYAIAENIVMLNSHCENYRRSTVTALCVCAVFISFHYGYAHKFFFVSFSFILLLAHTRASHIFAPIRQNYK